MANQTRCTLRTVLKVRRHTDKLMSFSIDRPGNYRFRAGQFARLGHGDLWRAYSIASPEYAETLDFYVVLVEDGPMSRRFVDMKPGDSIALADESQGFLLPGRFPDGRDLVMLSTGSGVAPFISQIQDPALFERFSNVMLVHSARESAELVFDDFCRGLANHDLVGKYAERFTYLPICTREPGTGRLSVRIPEALRRGLVQGAAPFAFDPVHTRFMICGNPAMVEDSFAALKELGFKMHRNKVPGHVIMENGF